MKYMLLIYDNANTRRTFLGRGESAGLMAEVDAVMEELHRVRRAARRRGAGRPLEHQEIRVADGAPAVTDGPFGEAKEHLAATCVDCESPSARPRSPRAGPTRRSRRRGAPAHGHRRRRRCERRADRHEDLLRALAPQVLGALVRRYGRFDACEDAVQEALLAAAVQWPREGVPDNPRGWLVTVASRRLTDQLRSEHARRRREDAPRLVRRDERRAAARDERPRRDADDTLDAAVPVLPPGALAGRRSSRSPCARSAASPPRRSRAPSWCPRRPWRQRISRAKQSIRAAGVGFELPPEAERAERLRRGAARALPDVQRGLHRELGTDLQRAELTREAIRLARAVLACCPTTARSRGCSRSCCSPMRGARPARAPTAR